MLIIDNICFLINILSVLYAIVLSTFRYFVHENDNIIESIIEILIRVLIIIISYIIINSEKGFIPYHDSIQILLSSLSIYLMISLYDTHVKGT